MDEYRTKSAKSDLRSFELNVEIINQERGGITIANSHVVEIYREKFGGLLNISASISEKDKLERPEHRRDLALVEPFSKRSSKGTFRIGISDDLFSPRRGAGDRARVELRNSSDEGGEDRHPEQGGRAARSETLIAFAVAGLILGYLIGRRDS